jgi:hypothetical protein
MTNPETYFRDAERLENDLFDWSRPEGRQSQTSKRNCPTARNRRYSRETLPSGCILYSLMSEKTMTSPKSAEPDAKS